MRARWVDGMPLPRSFSTGEKQSGKGRAWQHLCGRSATRHATPQRSAQRAGQPRLPKAWVVLVQPLPSRKKAPNSCILFENPPTHDGLFIQPQMFAGSLKQKQRDPQKPLSPGKPLQLLFIFLTVL